MKIIRVGFLFFAFGFICMLGNIMFCFAYITRLYKIKNFQLYSRFIVKHSWAFFIWLAKITGYLKYNFDMPNLSNGGNLIVANHPSLIDVVFFISKIENLNCVVKGDLQKNIFLKFAIKSCGYIPNTNNEIFLNKSIEALKSGENLLIFPEGTRTKDSINFHKAAFFVAVKSAKKIIPFVITMSPRSLSKNQKWYDTPNKTINYNFEVKNSIIIEDFYLQKPDPVRIRYLKDEIMKNYKEL